MRHDLLCEHVEWVAEVLRGLDRSVDHAPCHDRGFEQVTAMLRKDRSTRRFADLVPGAANAL